MLWRIYILILTCHWDSYHRINMQYGKKLLDSRNKIFLRKTTHRDQRSNNQQIAQIKEQYQWKKRIKEAFSMTYFSTRNKVRTSFNSTDDLQRMKRRLYIMMMIKILIKHTNTIFNTHFQLGIRNCINTTK